VHLISVQLLHQLEQSRLALRIALDAVPESQHENRPAPERWSVAEVLEHLALVERRSSLVLRGVAQKSRAGVSMTSAPDARDFPKHLLLDRTRKITAAEAVRPSGTVSVKQSLPMLEAARDEVKLLISQSGEEVFQAHAYEHPVFGPLNFRQWIEFLAGHEARHTAQIAEIGQQLKGQAG
jgi:hypothetical protein